MILFLFLTTMFLWRSVVSLLGGTSDSTVCFHGSPQHKQPLNPPQVSNLSKADIGVEKKRQGISKTGCPKTTALFHPTLQTRVDAGEHVHTHTCPYPGCEARCSRQDDFLYQCVFSLVTTRKFAVVSSRPLGGCSLFDDLTDELTTFSLSLSLCGSSLITIRARRNPFPGFWRPLHDHIK